MVIFDYVNKFVLHDIDIHIPRGVTVGIIGASGAGKTTFLKLVSFKARTWKSSYLTAKSC